MADPEQLAPLFPRFKQRIEALPEDFALKDLRALGFCLWKRGSLEVFYTPFDYVNTSAKLTLVGLTPGEQQLMKSLKAAREALRLGVEDEKVLESAKQAAAFAGTTRSNLINMLDDIGLPSAWPTISDTCRSLWGRNWRLVHATSAIRYAVLKKEANYPGGRCIFETPLRSYLDYVLLPELRAVPDSFIISLGKWAGAALTYLAEREASLRGRCVILPHPSGQNTGYRKKELQLHRNEWAQKLLEWFSGHALDRSGRPPTA